MNRRIFMKRLLIGLMLSLFLLGFGNSFSYAQSKVYDIGGTHIEVNEERIIINGSVTKWNTKSFFAGVPLLFSAHNTEVRVLNASNSANDYY